ncbi:MAG: prolyl oligopeptidase family serine peptidase [Anaerolineae bacterium]|nr:prolyl oligopeptidase family serine peptidase [Anaerolineae bacterium]
MVNRRIASPKTPDRQRCRTARVCLWTVLIVLVGCSRPSVQLGQHPYTFEQDNLQINYLLSLPEDYGKNPFKKWPLIVFLHGSGERGSTLEELDLLELQGLPRVIAERPDLEALAARFIVLSPQCDSWYWSMEFDAMDALLDDVQEGYAVDPKRIYLTGISMGGFGTWQYALRDPDRFAALAPFASGWNYVVEPTYVGYGPAGVSIVLDTSPPDNLCDLKEVPTWVFHGAQDVGIPAKETAGILVNGLQACGGNVRYTLYPDKAHDVWTDAYADRVLYDWLLEQRGPGN